MEIDGEGQSDQLERDEGNHAAVEVTVLTSGGATLRRKNREKPKGGVRKDVWRFTLMAMASHRGSKPKCSTSTGTRIGT